MKFSILALTILGALGNSQAAVTRADLDTQKYSLDDFLSYAWTYSPWGCTTTTPCRGAMDDEFKLWFGKPQDNGGYGPRGMYAGTRVWHPKTPEEMIRFLNGELIGSTWDPKNNGEIDLQMLSADRIHREGGYYFDKIKTQMIDPIRPPKYPAEIKEWATSGCPTRDDPHKWWPKASLDDNTVLCGGSYDTKEEADKVCADNAGSPHAGIDADTHGDQWCAFPRNDPEPFICPTPFHYGGCKDGKHECHGTWGTHLSEEGHKDLCPAKGGTWIPLDYWSNPYTCVFDAPNGCGGDGGGNPTASGDPHFETWSGEKYDFHGGCDLVLLQNNHFANGLGMNVHIRTSIRTWWSFIESAILQIGENTLQITGGIGSSTYSINGAEKSELVTGDAALGDYPIRFRRVNDHHTITRIDLGNYGDAIGIETFKDFVKVTIKDKKKTNFNGSTGMLGSYPDGKKVGRDGNTIFEDANAFGQEWMVRPKDNVLFSDVDVDNHPFKCTMPEATSVENKRRRLGAGTISEEDAAIACSRVDEAHRDTCIFDVLATMDLDMAGSY